MTPLDYRRHVRLAREAMASAGVNQLVVHSLHNIRWLTGFGGSNARMMLGEHEAVLITDGRYEEYASGLLEQLAGHGVGEIKLLIMRTGVEQALADATLSGGAVGFEADVATFAAYQRLSTAFGVDRLQPTTGVIARARQIKDAGEIERIEASADIADAAFAALLASLSPGQSEREVAAKLDFEMLSRGADGLSFDTIVASGPRSAMPHAEPSNRVLAVGDLVVFDFGAAVDGYRSDMTRTIVVGDNPSRRQQLLYDVVAAAQQAGVEAVADGIDAAAVDSVCRELITTAGFGEHFKHGAGHSLGLEIHEAPFLSSASVDTLANNMVVTVEPGIYLPGEGGIRIEDTVLIRPGGARRLTKTSKGL